MVSRLGVDELLHVFSFLEAPDLLRAAQVNTVWNEVSRTKELWRQLCLRRWSSCRASQMVPGTQTWKQYYLSRSELEFRVESGRPEDFVYKTIAGHTGQINQLAYVSTNEYRFDGTEKSVVCTVSADCTVRAWDLCEGTEIWSSPAQPAPLVNLVTYPQQQLVITVDTEGLIKVWGAETGCEGASFSLLTSCAAVEAYDQPENPFLLVVCARGNLYTLLVPQLKMVSKVFDVQSLLDPLEEEPPVCTILPVSLTSKACWAPVEAARLIVMHRNCDCTQMMVTTFELKADKSRGRVNTLVQQIVSFSLPDTMMPPHLMQSHGSQVILLACGSKLVLFTIYGHHLTTFQDHQRSITSLWVDANQVITSSLDLSLRIYTWNKENKIPALRSCYHLLGGSHRWANGFILVKSDSRSIVAVEDRSNGISILRLGCKDRTVVPWNSGSVKDLCLTHQHRLQEYKRAINVKLLPPFSLQEAKVNLVENKLCNTLYGQVSGNDKSYVHEEMLCAGDFSTGRSICRGDSGGPLVCFHPNIWVLVGLASWGLDCQHPVYPSVFTRVAYFLEWISEVKRQTPLLNPVSTPPHMDFSPSAPMKSAGSAQPYSTLMSAQTWLLLPFLFTVPQQASW
ncbi:F-box/WD repeat-containing protein 12-like isoform X3 [Dipodomys merriami]|uniref:F-box/WD repeat-containing protein 12-like isoform X3 n=1 Tax=Dipodomys merriami TaxID=94247 RepID=UPI0038558C69